MSGAYLESGRGEYVVRPSAVGGAGSDYIGQLQMTIILIKLQGLFL